VYQGKAARVVLHQDGTTSENPSLSAGATALPYSDIDGLFEDKPAYQSIKHEKPEHRLMLWLRLQGHNAKEIAAITGYTPEHVRTVCKQSWFREAFCRFSTAVGSDAVQTLLESHATQAVENLITLADSAVSENVRLAANDKILDRLRGKPTVKVETRTAASLDVTVTDVAKLLEEQSRLQQELSARGVFQSSQS